MWLTIAQSVFNKIRACIITGGGNIIPHIKRGILTIAALIAELCLYIGHFISTEVCIVVILLSILAWIIYIKLRYPFWNIQPVLHTYDQWWRRLFFPSGGIVDCRTNTKTMKDTKFCDTKNIRTFEMNDTTSPDGEAAISEYVRLLQAHYISNENVSYVITRKAFDGHFQGHLSSSYFSVLYNPVLSSFAGGVPDAVKSIQDIIGGIASSPAMLFVQNTEYAIKPIDVNYIDYLCVHRDHAHKLLARNLFQTHERNIRQLSLASMTAPRMVSVFRKEMDLCDGVVPMVEYKTNVYYLRNILVPPLPPRTMLQRAWKNNAHSSTFFDFIDDLPAKQVFDIILMPSASHLRASIANENIFAFVLIHESQLLGVYIFSDVHVVTEGASVSATEDGGTLQLSASFRNVESTAVFFAGFLICLQQILNVNKSFAMLHINDVGHNQHILPRWHSSGGGMPVYSIPAAVYAYNYINPTLFPGLPARSFII